MVRATYDWLAAGSHTVQQQALRDFHHAMANFFRGTHGRPTWRKAGRNDGFRQVAVRPGHVQRLNRRNARVWVPKIGWIRFRWTRDVAAGVKSYRVTRRVEKTSTDLARHHDLIRVERLTIAGMTRSARGTIAAPGRNVRAKSALNRGILFSGWGLLVARLEQQAPGRVEQVRAVFTSQTCSACGHCAAESRESQAVFRCVACGYRINADVNATRYIAAGRAVTARGGHRVTGPTNREPQLVPPSSA